MALFWGHFPKFFKAINYNQKTIESSKLGSMYIFWGEKFDLQSKFDLEQSLCCHKACESKFEFVNGWQVSEVLVKENKNY